VERAGSLLPLPRPQVLSTLSALSLTARKWAKLESRVCSPSPFPWKEGGKEGRKDRRWDSGKISIIPPGIRNRSILIDRGIVRESSRESFNARAYSRGTRQRRSGEARAIHYELSRQVRCLISRLIHKLRSLRARSSRPRGRESRKNVRRPARALRMESASTFRVATDRSDGWTCSRLRCERRSIFVRLAEAATCGPRSIFRLGLFLCRDSPQERSKPRFQASEKQIALIRARASARAFRA